jgi:hypothetical protein
LAAIPYVSSGKIPDCANCPSGIERYWFFPAKAELQSIDQGAGFRLGWLFRQTGNKEVAGMESNWSLEGWYFCRRETLLGPVTTGELWQLLAGGQLQEADTIWKGWQRAGDRQLLPTSVRAVLGLGVQTLPALGAPGLQAPVSRDEET